MKSYSDDLPNVTKEEVERATATAREAVTVSETTLAVAEQLSHHTEKYHYEIVTDLEKQRKLTIANTVLLGINLVISIGTLSILLLPYIK
jgi:hypothetical protein